MAEDLKQKLDLKQKAWKDKKKGHLHSLNYHSEQIRTLVSRIEKLIEDLSRIESAPQKNIEELELKNIRSIGADVADIENFQTKEMKKVLNEMDDEISDIKSLKDDIGLENERESSFEHEVVSRIMRKAKLNLSFKSRF